MRRKPEVIASKSIVLDGRKLEVRLLRTSYGGRPPIIRPSVKYADDKDEKIRQYKERIKKYEEKIKKLENENKNTGTTKS